ncbi:MAG: DUF6690 family protein [Pirellulales bacterium]
MTLRRLLLALTLGGAAYGYYQTRDGATHASGSLLRHLPGFSSGSADVPGVDPIRIEEGTAAPQTIEMADALRFDVTPDWVMRTWGRVSTGLASLDLQGYRVTLVTGPAEHDLAGALTFYFDSRQRLRRVTFVGTTGDYRALAQFLASRFAFRPVEAPNPRHVAYAPREPLVPFGTHYQGRLDVTPAPVVWGSAPRHRYQVNLVIEAA